MSKDRFPAPSHQRYRVIRTALGPFNLFLDANGEVRTGWGRFGPPVPEEAVRDDDILAGLSQRLDRWFSGEPEDFRDVPVPAGPPFYVSCWLAARDIPRGDCMTYGGLARAAGRPGAARAAGQAMRHNPQPVLTPCHRVLPSGGGPGGFAGSDRSEDVEVRMKSALLGLEGIDPDSPR